MGQGSLRKGALLAGLLAVMVFSQFKAEKIYKIPFPSLDQLIVGKGVLQDVSFVAMGFRALAADVAWIQLLQNMGDPGRVDLSKKSLPLLKQQTLRVTRLDPYFLGAYLFGAATLGWLKNVNRPEEALEVLQEGIQWNPNFWWFRVYSAGIIYQQANQRPRMIRMLEEARRDPNCPTIILSILANAYKLDKRYDESLKIWEEVLSSTNRSSYHDRAREEVVKIRQLLANSAKE